MVEEEKITNNKRLVWLIRRIAREVAYEVMEEHLDDYEHEKKYADEMNEP
jgi:predicted nucleotidyltransferase